MTTTDPPTPAPGGADGRRPPLSRLVGRRPNQGAPVAAKTVIDDFQALLRAEIALAKAEITDGAKAKVLGAGFFIGVAVIGWLAIQVLLVFLGFLFALFLPGWAAVGLVLLLLLIAMGVLGFLGYNKITAELNLRTTKATVDEAKRVVRDAVDDSARNVKDGVAEAKVEVTEALREVKVRLDERRGVTAAPAAQITATTPARAGDAPVATMPPTATTPATILTKQPITPPATGGSDQ